MSNPSPPLPRFLGLYAALFAAFGVASPFLPALLKARGLDSNAIAVVLGLGSAVRLVAGPLGGRWADRTGPRVVLVAGLAASAVVALGYGPAHGLMLLALVAVLHAAVLAPLTPVADALALRFGPTAPDGFDYGWVRGAGSAAFIAGNLVAGVVVGWRGLGAIIAMNAALLGLAAAVAAFLPRPPGGEAPPAARASGGWGALWRVPGFAIWMLLAALIGGSHTLHDGFEVIRWQDAGMGSGAAGALWGLSVASEVLVFFVAGRPIIDRLGLAGAAMVSAGAGIVRWSVAALTAAVPAMVLVEPLHGLTFALLHLVIMRVIANTVPVHLAATAQAIYGTVAVGATTTALTFASGPLYGHFGAAAFWTMAALCAAALVVAARTPAPPRALPGVS